MNSAKPLRADAQRNRAALLTRAKELFDTGEFFDLRFDELARLTGVGTGTLYRHLPTREALAEAVYGLITLVLDGLGLTRRSTAG